MWTVLLQAACPHAALGLGGLGRCAGANRRGGLARLTPRLPPPGAAGAVRAADRHCQRLGGPIE